MKAKTKQNKAHGFTLIELLVVISIIGLLASVVLVALNSARQKSRDAKRISDMNQMSKAFELFFNTASAYPTGTGTAGSATSYVLAGGRLLGSATLQAYKAGTTEIITMTPTFLVKIPTAPLPHDDGTGGCTATSNLYMYETNNFGTTYTMTFCLGENVGGQQGGLPAGVRYMTPGGFK